VNSNQINRLQEIIDNIDNTRWLSEKNIDVSQKAQYYIINYGIGETNEYNQLVRGMVVDSNKNIIGLPFTRFFNYGERHGAEVSFVNCDAIEKLDGCFVSLFYDKNINEWIFATRRMISKCVLDQESFSAGWHGQSYSLIKEIQTHIDDLLLRSHAALNCNDNITFSFEFIHPSTEVLTKYEPADYGLYLIGARSLTDYTEFSESALDWIAKTIVIRRPLTFSATNLEDVHAIIDAQNKHTKNFEGLVIRDRITGDRLKIKSPEYVRLHKFIGKTNTRAIVDAIVNGDDDEIVAYFPYIKEERDTLLAKINTYISQLTHAAELYLIRAQKHNWSRKDLWLNMEDARETDRYMMGFIMGCFSKQQQNPEYVEKFLGGDVHTKFIGAGTNRILECICQDQ
jgi:hypothetical protein